VSTIRPHFRSYSMDVSFHHSWMSPSTSRPHEHTLDPHNFRLPSATHSIRIYSHRCTALQHWLILRLSVIANDLASSGSFYAFALFFPRLLILIALYLVNYHINLRCCYVNTEEVRDTRKSRTSKGAPWSERRVSARSPGTTLWMVDSVAHT